MKVLIVDDEDSMRKVLRLALEKEGISVNEAVDGSLALQTAFDIQPDLIVLDINMPEMDGIKVMEKLREDEWGKDVPIIILTNYSPTKSKVLEAVALSKPAFVLLKYNSTIDDIVDKIKKLLLL